MRTSEGAHGRRRAGRLAGASRAGARAWLLMSNAWRKPALAASKGLGRLQRRGSRGPWPFAVLLAAVVAFLALTPVLLNLLVSLIPDASRRRFGIDAAPAVRDWLSLANVALAFAAVATVRALARARERVIVESFADYTKEDAKAVSGLATLRVTELGRLRELVRHVDTDVAIPAGGVSLWICQGVIRRRVRSPALGWPVLPGWAARRR